MWSSAVWPNVIFTWSKASRHVVLTTDTSSASPSSAKETSFTLLLSAHVIEEVFATYRYTDRSPSLLQLSCDVMIKPPASLWQAALASRADEVSTKCSFIKSSSHLTACKWCSCSSRLNTGFCEPSLTCEAKVGAPLHTFSSCH